jgi:hypothetical protein
MYTWWSNVEDSGRSTGSYWRTIQSAKKPLHRLIGGKPGCHSAPFDGKPTHSGLKQRRCARMGRDF